MAETETTATVTTGTDGTTTVTDWRESIPKEIRYSEEGSDYFHQFSDPIILAKSYRELEKSSSAKVKIPDDSATPQERSAFYDKIGRPKTAGEYDVKIPEGTPVDDKFVSVMSTAAYDAGIPKTAFQSLVGKYLDYMNGELEATRIAGETQLKTDWKENYDKNIEITQRAYKAFDTDGAFGELMKSTGLGNNPVVVKVFHGIGLKMLDDTLVKGQPAKGEGDYKPSHPNSPEMYANGDDEESRKARAYFRKQGHVYGRED